MSSNAQISHKIDTSEQCSRCGSTTSLKTQFVACGVIKSRKQGTGYVNEEETAIPWKISLCPNCRQAGYEYHYRRKFRSNLGWCGLGLFLFFFFGYFGLYSIMTNPHPNIFTSIGLLGGFVFFINFCIGSHRNCLLCISS